MRAASSGNGGPAWEAQREKVREVFLAVGSCFDIRYTLESYNVTCRSNVTDSGNEIL